MCFPTGLRRPEGCRAFLIVSIIFSSFAQTKTEAETLHYRNKIQSLQADLENSEAVQRDFVKLSQSLQVCETVIGEDFLTNHDYFANSKKIGPAREDSTSEQ